MVRHAGRVQDDMSFKHDPAGGCQPLFPLMWVLRRVVGVKDQGPAEWTAALLCLQQAQAGPVYRQGCSLRRRSAQYEERVGSSVRRRRAFAHLVSDDPGPGELDDVGSADAVADYPLVLPGPVDWPKYRAVTSASACSGGFVCTCR